MRTVDCARWPTVARGSPARGKSGHHQTAGRGESAGVAGESPPRQTVSQKTDRPARKLRARVKRRGKSPPPAQQCAGHEKPSAVQDITGGPASGPPAHESATIRRRQPPGNSRPGGAGFGSLRRPPPPGGWREMIVTRRASDGNKIRLMASKSGRPGETRGALTFGNAECGMQNSK